ncbi:fibronectin type 3 and ankyrin repeat domains protein 1, partial [Clarias magur]
MCSDPVLEDEVPMSHEVIVVEKVDHCSIELSWKSEEDRSGSPDEWTRFDVEQMDPRTKTFVTIYIGHSNHFIVENLVPEMSYQFRLRITKPSGECSLTAAVSASTTSEPVSGKQLHQAVNRNDEDELNRLLESGITNLDIFDKLGNTPLMVAAQKGFSRIVHILIQHGADISMRNASGKDCLMLACFAGHLDIVKHLRVFGATWQSQDMNGCTALHWAVDGAHVPVIDFLIEDGCEVDAHDTVSEWTPLMRVSAISGNADVASLLIQAGADVNTRDKDGKTPLMVAVLNNHEELVKLLLDSGADQHVTNMVQIELKLLLKYASEQLLWVKYSGNGRSLWKAGCHQIVGQCTKARLSIWTGADISVRDKDGKTPLQNAYGKAK